MGPLELVEFPLLHVFEPQTEENVRNRRIRQWLLDAAIYQYSQPHLIPKKRVYLPDEVFKDPGMNQIEMLNYLIRRKASHGCIKYAMTKYNEGRAFDSMTSKSSGTVSGHTQSGDSLECQGTDHQNSPDPAASSRLSSLLKRLRRMF